MDMRADGKAEEEHGKGTKAVYVGNLDFAVEDHDLKSLLSNCGTIVALKWGVDAFRKVFLGYAHVEFTQR